MKKLILILVGVLFLKAFVFADLGVTMYAATTGTGKATQAGTVYVNFAAVGFTGTIGNASLSNVTLNFPISSGYQGGVGQRLNAIPYIYTSGTLVITEVK